MSHLVATNKEAPENTCFWCVKPLDVFSRILNLTRISLYFYFVFPAEAPSGDAQKSEGPTETPLDPEVSSEALLQSTEIIEDSSVAPPPFMPASRRATYATSRLMDSAYATSPLMVKGPRPRPLHAWEEGTLESDPEAYPGEDSRGGEEQRHTEDGGIRLADSGLRPASPAPTTRSIATSSSCSTLPPPYAEYS